MNAIGLFVGNIFKWDRIQASLHNLALCKQNNQSNRICQLGRLQAAVSVSDQALCALNICANACWARLSVVFVVGGWKSMRFGSVSITNLHFSYIFRLLKSNMRIDLGNCS